MADQIISVVAIGDVENFILEYISRSISPTFKIKSRVERKCVSIEDVKEFVYGEKFNSTGLLKFLFDRLSRGIQRLLALTEADLYSPIFSNFYGEAQLNGRCALVSLYRLKQEYYNLKPDHELFLSRVEKVAIHELAHTFGLVHCLDRNCVMHASNNIIDTDSKSNAFCPSCSEVLLTLEN